MNVLAGDIGGTNARLALVDMANGRATIRAQRTYPSKDFPGLAPVVRTFCEEIGTRPSRACFGVACPSIDDECRAPNLKWTVDAKTLAADIEIASAALINDFSAAGHGIALLGPEDIVTLQAGEPKPRAPIALLGAGTGLGVGFLTWGGERYEVHPSEGGHAGFAPRGAVQGALAAALEQEFGRVSRERVLSGRGIVNIYRFLATAGSAAESAAVRAEMEREDPAAVISRHGVAGTDPLCRQALDLFVDALGALAGDLALNMLVRGGVYVGGGIAPRLISLLREGGFVRAFGDKGRMSTYLVRVPVHVIVNTHVGLLGAAAVAAALP
jgi:glucokinase